VDVLQVPVLAMAATYLARTYDQPSQDGETVFEEFMGAIPAILAKHQIEESEQLEEDVLAMLERADLEGWAAMEWYENMQTVLEQSKTNGLPLEEEDEEEEDGPVRVGGGEMAMYAEDWGGEKKRREYVAWEKGIRSRIKSMNR